MDTTRSTSSSHGTKTCRLPARAVRWTRKARHLWPSANLSTTASRLGSRHCTRFRGRGLAERLNSCERAVAAHWLAAPLTGRPMRERAVFRLRRPVHIEQAHGNRRRVHRLGSGPVSRVSTEPVETESLQRWAELEDEEMRRLHARYAWRARRASGRIVVGAIRILHVGEQLR